MNKKTHIIWIILWELFLLYFFLVSIKLMGAGFRGLGKGFAEGLIAATTNPFAGLFIGILSTSIVQSSSFTTAVTVGLVASGTLPASFAVPIIMGANIGTAVTNTIVSLGHIHRKEEIREAFAAATVHDFFNILTVIILFPLQIGFGFLERISKIVMDALFITRGIEIFNPLKFVTSPCVKFLRDFLKHPIIIIIFSVVLLVVCLIFLGKSMRGIVGTKLEKALITPLFNSKIKSFSTGFALTVIVESSSVTTSLVIPLAGARILPVERLYHYILGANIGTTIGTILAGFGTGDIPAITIAFCHLLFNCIGTIIFTIFSKIPIKMSRFMGNLVAEKRYLAFVYVGIIFFVIPLILILLWR